MRIAVLGAGSWGTVLAHLLAVKGHRVRLWAYERQVVSAINAEHRNPLYATELALRDTISATSDAREAVADAEMLLFVIPVQFVRSTLKEIYGALSPGIPIVVCSKGIERGTFATMEQLFLQELSESNRQGYCVLSGPSFAQEVAKGMPTNVTLASRCPRLAKQVQSMIATRAFRVYTTDDVTGVEVGGAMKNVIAIAAGASDELGFGYNTRAALITRGLAEITRLAVSLNGKPETLLGLSGVGDLFLTCTSDLSRNRLVGRSLARGRRLAEIQQEMTMVAEGVTTTDSAYQLARARGIDLPITEQIYQVLYQDKSVPAAMAALQDRALKDEWTV
ncbi:MAG: NAD(P)-dependent glycerol-3-phosphate dehydrogenase [Deltaproteobacteria bacterium]|nr:NAD(P)-dependent glycerol-3-phosphate dehydrogenase [Deltaproteobacteria bacterium]